jgi:hypothetical protein
LKKIVAVVALVVTLGLSAASLLVGCGGRPATSGTEPPASQRPPGATPTSASPAAPVAVPALSDREGPSWKGDLGDTVEIGWYDQARGATAGERIAVLAVRRVAAPDDSGPYDWKYGIKVRLTSLDETTARDPIAYQFLRLTRGSDWEDGIAGLGKGGGPDPSTVGRPSVGWLYQWAEEGFRPTEVVVPVGAWQATWSLD